MSKTTKVAARNYRVPVNVQRFGFWLAPDLVERARNAVDFLAGPPERLTLSGLVARALEAELERLSRKYRNGGAFPRRPGELRRGSRPKG
jgi:hypothetical protein